MHWTEPSEIENAAARNSAQELRKQLIASQVVDVMVAVVPNLSTPSRSKNGLPKVCALVRADRMCFAPRQSWAEQFQKTQVVESESQVTTLQRQIQNLRRTRDLLRPRLLSGEVERDRAEVIWQSSDRLKPA